MVKEAAVIVIDNSEYSRNEDFEPSRFAAQVDAADYVFTAKLSDNAETNVAIVAGAGKSCDVLTSLTAQRSTFSRVRSNMSVNGNFNFSLSLNIARMVLKNTPISSKRIIVFVASPITEDSSMVESLAKKMRKNNICVDIVDLSQIEENKDKIDLFHEAVNKDSTSHKLVADPNGESLRNQVRKALFTSGGATGGGFGDFDDPTIDHELAEAIRLSLQEVGGTSNAGQGVTGTGGGADSQDMHMDETDEDRDIRLAIELSLRESGMHSDQQQNKPGEAPKDNEGNSKQ
ncbi:proteasome regulatory particle base subunit rpn10 [Spiromyces aspiralis]|uniref:Proteasome regulatory particle base subunit rpn10 n=1 Tax=Spiromyces aspiralis TaxID=68401 RepID=A0ACC1HX62_9FUNG|nr:proteasome regulatory particle base subunit rpn10 [Spiromyces aspiralis]